MVKFIQIIGLYILAPSLLAQIDTIPQRFRNGSNNNQSILRNSVKTHEDTLLDRTTTTTSNNYINNLRILNEQITIDRDLQQQVLSMSFPAVTLAEMSIPSEGSGSDDMAFPTTTYSPLPAPNMDEFDVDEVISWICRFCPSTICSSCVSASR